MAKIYNSDKHAKSAWRGRCRRNQKPWGEELVWTGHDSIHGKILFIHKGNRTSFKYHPLKAESLFFLRGKARVTYGDEKSLNDPVAHPIKVEEFGTGDALFVQSGCPYRIEAIEDCEVIEIGNHLSSPVVRIEDDYGRSTEKEK
jgi:mannose-6-phosphate isomerase-like protein (cupin superfamily)